MADYDSSLPVRTEGDADEKIQSKLVDYTTPSQGAAIDSDGNLQVEVHGVNPAAGDEKLRLSELGAPNPDGDYDGTNNTKPASVGLIVHDRAASPADTDQNVRVTGVQGSTSTTVHAIDVALRDATAEPFSTSNPLPVAISDDKPGDETHAYDTAAAVAADATDEHTYSVASGDTFYLYGFHGSASGKAKFELQIGDGAASEVFTTKAVLFNSTANPNVEANFFRVPIIVVGTANTTTIKIIRTNRDESAQDLYSTIVGIDN